MKVTKSKENLIREALDVQAGITAGEIQWRKRNDLPTKRLKNKLKKLRVLFRDFGGTKFWWEKR